MKVYFIGAGPGAADLITVRGAEILARVNVVMYAGSLVPPTVLKYCRPDAKIIDTSSLNLDEQIAIYKQAQLHDNDVARVHSGDPAIYGATFEQMRYLDEMKIPFEIVPGVSSFTAAASALKSELTKPNISQTIILTRVSGRASAVPDSEALAKLAAHRATICIFLSGPHLTQIVKDLRVHYTADTPIALVYKASTNDQRIHQSTLEHIIDEIEIKDWQLTTMLIVGDVLRKDIGDESCLYSSAYSHRFRKARQEVL